MQLPKIISEDQTMQLMQTKWAAILNPLLAQPISNNNFLQNVALIAGDNVINHLLSRNQQGWVLADIDAASVVYRNADFNDKTLTLNASAPCNVNLIVF